MIDDLPVNDLGEQPMLRIIGELKLKPHDIVAASTEQITHKMVSKAAKGRRLTPKVKLKILRAMNKASGKKYLLRDLFNY